MRHFATVNQSTIRLTRGDKQRESSGQGIAARGTLKESGSHTPQNRIAMSSAD